MKLNIRTGTTILGQNVSNLPEMYQIWVFKPWKRGKLLGKYTFVCFKKITIKKPIENFKNLNMKNLGN